MTEEVAIDGADVERAVQLVQNAGLEIDAALESLGIEPAEWDVFKARIAEAIPGTDAAGDAEKVRKEYYKQAINGRIIGLESEREQIEAFLNNVNERFLLVIGRTNAGKSMLLEDILAAFGIYHETVFDIDEFLNDETHLARYKFPVVFVMEPQDDEKKKKSPAKKTGKKKRAPRGVGFWKFIEKGETRVKIIAVGHAVSEEHQAMFDRVVRFKDVPFDDVYEYLKAHTPDLLKEEKDALERRYIECGKDVYHFLYYIENGSVIKERVIEPMKECLLLTEEIFTSPDRDAVFTHLSTVLEKDRIAKHDEGRKVKYIDGLEKYLIENVENYFPPGPDYYHNLRLFQHVRDQKHRIGVETIIFILSRAISITAVQKKAIIPFSETRIAKKLYFRAKEKRDAASKGNGVKVNKAGEPEEGDDW